MSNHSRITSMFKLLPILLMSLLSSAAVAHADDEPVTDPVETSTEETIADYLNHANTMYWVSRARPWSLTEVARAIEFYDLAEQMLEDEARHAETALEAGGHRFPKPVLKIMTLISSAMTKSSYKL